MFFDRKNKLKIDFLASFFQNKKMGYDDCECLFCYTRNCGNEITDDIIEICFSCLEKHIGKNITGRVLNIFSQYIVSSNVTCNVCKEIKKLTCEVKCCKDHTFEN